MKCFASINEDQHINVIEHIDNTEYNKVKGILQNVGKIELIYSAKFPLVENYKEIVDLLDKYKKDQIQQIVFKYLIIVRIQNFLSSARGFMDTFAHTLSKEYGKEADVYIEFNKQKSTTYDNHFSYRFIEALRNCVQHRELPLSLIRESPNNGSKIIELIINKEDLLHDEKISQKKKKDIDENCLDEIELMMHLTNMFSYLLNIHENMFNMVIDSNQTKEFFMYEEKFADVKEFPILLNIEDKENGSTIFQPWFFNFDIIRGMLKDMNN